MSRFLLAISYPGPPRSSSSPAIRPNPSYGVPRDTLECSHGINGEKSLLVGRKGGRSSTQNSVLYKREGKRSELLEQVNFR